MSISERNEVSRRSVIGTGTKVAAGAAALAFAGLSGRLGLAHEGHDHGTPEATPEGGEARFVSARSYTLAEGKTYEEFITNMPGFVEIISQVPGFIAYYNFQTSETDFTAISIFTSEEGMVASDEAAAQYIIDEVSEFVGSGPETSEGVAGIFSDSHSDHSH